MFVNSYRIWALMAPEGDEGDNAGGGGADSGGAADANVDDAGSGAGDGGSAADDDAAGDGGGDDDEGAEKVYATPEDVLFDEDLLPDEEGGSRCSTPWPPRPAAGRSLALPAAIAVADLPRGLQRKEHRHRPAGCWT